MKHADILYEASDHSVVKLPYRSFPSITFQGDTLFCLLARLQKIKSSSSDTSKMLEEIVFLEMDFASILNLYKKILIEYKYSIPFEDVPLSRPCVPDDDLPSD